MKPFYLIIAMLIAGAWPLSAQNSAPVPKYDLATENTFKGSIVELSERVCPVSGGLGSHFMLKLQGGKTIEVHVTAAKFMKDYGVVLREGDEVAVLGSKVNFEGAETILARQISDDKETFVFRDKTGKPVW